MGILAIIGAQIWPKSNDSVANSGSSVVYSAHSAIFVPIWIDIRVIIRGILARLGSILITFGSILEYMMHNQSELVIVSNLEKKKLG